MGYEENRAQWEPVVRQAAQQYGIPEEVFVRLINQESGFNPQAQSGAGAQGIAQFMPATAAGLEIDPWDPNQAIYGAARYLRQLMDGFGGDLTFGVAAYNAGPGTIGNLIDEYGTDNWRAGLPDETKTYLSNILGGTAGQPTAFPNTGGDPMAGPIDTANPTIDQILRAANSQQGIQYWFPNSNIPSLLQKAGWNPANNENSKFWKSLNPDNFATPDAYSSAMDGIAKTMALAEVPLPGAVKDNPLLQASYAAWKNYFASQKPTQDDRDYARLKVVEMQNSIDKGQLDITQMRQAIDQANTLFPVQFQAAQQALDENRALQPYKVDQLKYSVKILEQQYNERGQKIPYEVDLLKQSLRLNEPYGQESILRSPGGSAGYRDYWSGKGVDQARTGDADYMAGYNFGQAQERPQKSSDLVSSMNQVLAEVQADIAARGLKADQAAAEFKRRLDAFSEGATQFKDIQPYTIPTGSKYIPGFEPGSPGAGYLSQPGGVAATPIHYDPFGMALQVLNSTPDITSIGAPEVPTPNMDLYNRALAALSQGAGIGV